MSDFYNSFVTGLNRGQFDWVRDQFNVWLVGGEYEPSPTHMTRADLGGFELGDAQPLRDRAVDEFGVTASSVDWYGFTGTFRYAVICRDQDLVMVTDLGEQTFTDATVSLNFSDGVYELRPQATDG